MSPANAQRRPEHGIADPKDAPSVERAERVFQRLDVSEIAPYPGREYVRKAAWMLVQATVYRAIPSRFPAIQNAVLRLFGARIGKGTHLRRTARIRHPWLLTIGDYAAVGDNVDVYNLGPIIIGNHTTISQNAHLCAGTHDYTKPHLPLVRAGITIGDGVWVCADAFIGPNVGVGDNCIVGARAVVTRSVPANTIVAGNPAKPVRERPMPG